MVKTLLIRAYDYYTASVKLGLYVHFLHQFLSEEECMIRLRVKEIAEQKNISQSKLGRLADVDVKTMQRIYRNPTTVVTTAVLDRIAIALNVDISLLVESDPPLPKVVWSVQGEQERENMKEPE